MPSAPDSRTPDPIALEEAADWLIRLGEAELDQHERAQWERWKDSSPERQQAWARAQRLQSKMGGLPASLALSVLDRPHSPDRRAALRKLAVLLAATPLGWAGWELTSSQQWLADYRSGVGQRRELTLADGSRITLNTATAIDVRFDASQRLVHLREGEIMVQTAPDLPALGRPFVVSTSQGRMQALGTRFSVREIAPRTHLAVLEGAVRVMLAAPGQTPPVLINAGQRMDFSADAFGPLNTAERHVDAWTRGLLMADRMPLAELVSELARYRQGILRCDPAIAGLPVSGAYPVSDTQRTLNMLAHTYPIKVTGHLGGFWTSLAPA